MEISTAKNNLSSIFLTLILIKVLCANGLNKFRFLNLFKIKSVLFLNYILIIVLKLILLFMAKMVVLF